MENLNLEELKKLRLKKGEMNQQYLHFQILKYLNMQKALLVMKILKRPNCKN